MATILILLAPIALLDSTSVIPLSIVALAILLAKPRPLLTSGCFILGTFSIYLLTGLLLLVGLEGAFDQLEAYSVEFDGPPNKEEVIFQISLGLLLCAFGLKLAKIRGTPHNRITAESASPGRAFLLGIGLTFFGMPGGLPYLAAIQLVLRAELPFAEQLLAVLFYNLVFVSPLALIAAIPLIFGPSGQEILQRVRRFVDRWGQKIIVSLLVGFGLLLAIDGVAWFLGFPMILL